MIPVRRKAITAAAAMGRAIWYRLTPEAFITVISLSPDSRPSPIRIETSRDMGMVNMRKEGISSRTNFMISRKPTPLLTKRSMSCRILPISRTNVRMKRTMTKGSAISRRM